MATVHLGRATDKRRGPPLVAIKRPHKHLASDKMFLSMLVDEARLASSIQHDNVVKVRELGFEGGVPFIVMDYVEGASLAELRRELSAIGRAIDARVAVRIVLDALAGLHAAHTLEDDAGKPLHLVHRDISPHNVLLGCDGRARLTDFGIAKAEDRIQTTRTHEVKGKLAYLAPERIDRRRVCTVQSDVFSMAVVFWECFAGRRLFRGDEAVDILQAVMSAPIPTLQQIGAQVPPALDDVIARALSRDLDTRYADAAELGEAIERAAGREHTGTHADVARLMEAVFAARMALRQEHVRAMIGSGDLDDLLRMTGLPSRERTSLADVPAGQLLAELAPPAPTGRYAGTVMQAVARMRARPVPWKKLALVGAGVALGTMVTLGYVSVSSQKKPAAPIVIRAAPAPTAVPAPTATVRRVIVPLPFLSTHVTFGDIARDLDPATDVVSFDVPAESAQRRRVTMTGIDGTRAEGYVREEDGIARADGDGYAFVPQPPPSSSIDTRPASPPPAPPLGTKRNGFTKLR